MKNIYVLYGESGERDLFCSWDVAAYKKEKDAEKRRDELRTVLVECGCGCGVEYKLRAEIEKKIREHPLGDKNFCMDYTGTEYSIRAIPLL